MKRYKEQEAMNKGLFNENPSSYITHCSLLRMSNLPRSFTEETLQTLCTLWFFKIPPFRAVYKMSAETLTPQRRLV
jgi:hypothetical protein